MLAYNHGQRDFGENYVEELVSKQKELPKDIRWHFIGHLQSNKVNKLMNANVHMIQTIDSIKLAKKLNDKCRELSRKLEIMTQINISEEDSKAGIHKKELHGLVDFIVNECESLVLKGFMILGELGNVDQFNELRQIRDKYQEEYSLQHLDLCMGTSGDYREAIQTGATS